MIKDQIKIVMENKTIELVGIIKNTENILENKINNQYKTITENMEKIYTDIQRNQNNKEIAEIYKKIREEEDKIIGIEY